MIEDTKKAHNVSLTENVEDSNNSSINSKYIIESHNLLQQGFSVYLLAKGTNAPYKGSRGHLDAVNNVRDLTNMFKKYGANSNVGIILKGTGIAVLDIDKHSTNGFKSLIQSGHKLNLDKEVLDFTPRGAHVFFKIPEGVRADELKHNLMAGVELLTDKVTISPSFKLVDGIEVEYKRFGGEITDCSVMPDWLVKMASNVATSGNKRASSKAKYSIQERWEMVLNGFTEGERNVQALSLAGYLLRIDIDPNTAYEIVGSVNERSKNPLPEKELDTVYLHAYKAEEKRRLGGVHA